MLEKIRTMKESIIITAGGTGKRMGGTLPKQFLLLSGKPLLMYTIQRFHEALPDAEIIISLPADWISFWIALCKQHQFYIAHELVEGGTERFHSIQNALHAATGRLIGVHDGVRPFVSIETIRNCFVAAASNGSAIPVIGIKESVREVSGSSSKAVLRANYRLVQTPQVFHAEILRNAYQQNFHDGITDDASLVENLGVEICLVQGDESNIKITTPMDLKMAEWLLELQ